MEIKEADLVNLPRCIEAGERYYRDILGRMDFDFAYSLARWVDLVRRGEGAAFYVEDAGKVVGIICGTSSVSMDTGYSEGTIAHWCVDKEASGYGIRLLWRFREWARSKGCRSFLLTCATKTWDDRHAALYKRLGFSETGRRFRMENK